MLRIAAVALLVVLCGWLLLRLVEILSVYLVFHSPFRKRRTAEFRCDNCNYDLRASPEQCPECGARVPPMKATFVRYLMRIDKLDDLERRRRARGERH